MRKQLSLTVQACFTHLETISQSVPPDTLNSEEHAPLPLLDAIKYRTEDIPSCLQSVSGAFTHHAQVYENLQRERPQIFAQVKELEQRLARVQEEKEALLASKNTEINNNTAETAKLENENKSLKDENNRLKSENAI